MFTPLLSPQNLLEHPCVPGLVLGAKLQKCPPGLCVEQGNRIHFLLGTNLVPFSPMLISQARLLRVHTWHGASEVNMAPFCLPVRSLGSGVTNEVRILAPPLAARLWEPGKVTQPLRGPGSSL